MEGKGYIDARFRLIFEFPGVARGAGV